MSKNRNSRSQGNMNYNRPSGGYQKNLYRQKLNAEGIKAPKGVDSKKLRIYAIVVGVIWIALSIFLIFKLKWIGLIIGLVIGIIGVGGLYLFMQHKQKEIITYYKKIGLTEDLYITELKRRNVPPKQLDAYRKMWRKVKI